MIEVLTSLSAQIQLIHFINDLRNFTGKEVRDKKQPAKNNQERGTISCEWVENAAHEPEWPKTGTFRVFLKSPESPHEIFRTRFCAIKIKRHQVPARPQGHRIIIDFDQEMHKMHWKHCGFSAGGTPGSIGPQTQQFGNTTPAGETKPMRVA